MGADSVESKTPECNFLFPAVEREYRVLEVVASVPVAAEYSWIGRPVQAHTKNFRETERAPTDLNIRT